MNKIIILLFIFTSNLFAKQEVVILKPTFKENEEFLGGDIKLLAIRDENSKNNYWLKAIQLNNDSPQDLKIFEFENGTIINTSVFMRYNTASTSCFLISRQKNLISPFTQEKILFDDNKIKKICMNLKKEKSQQHQSLMEKCWYEDIHQDGSKLNFTVYFGRSKIYKMKYHLDLINLFSIPTIHISVKSKS